MQHHENTLMNYELHSKLSFCNFERKTKTFRAKSGIIILHPLLQYKN